MSKYANNHNYTVQFYNETLGCIMLFPNSWDAPKTPGGFPVKDDVMESSCIRISSKTADPSHPLIDKPLKLCNMLQICCCIVYSL